MNKHLLTLLFMAFSLVAFAQTEHVHNEKCGHNIIMNSMEAKFPGYKNAVNNTFRTVQENASLSTSRTDDIYTIPVVVHVVWKEEEENLSDDQINDQIDVLNEDFRIMNADFANLRTEFGDVAADTYIEFDLIAIERVETTETFNLDLFNGFEDSKLKNTANGGSSPYDTDTHLNIWVCNVQPTLFGQILGLAYPPVNLADYPDLNNFPAEGLPTEPEYNGVVIHYPAFGGRDRNVNIDGLGSIDFEGRTTVHEVGHYLGLRHIWGDPNFLTGEDGCTVDDGIEDTPNSADNSQATGCEVTKNTCTDASDDLPDMWENYMDYSLESCQVTFTQGQVDIMRGVLEGPRGDLATSTSTSNQQVDNLLGSISLAPNPTEGIVTLSINDNTNEDYRITVRNILGKEVMNPFANKGNNTLDINLSSMTNGVYFIEIQKGNIRAAKKVVLAK